MTSDDGMDAQDNAWAQLARRLEKTERAVREMRAERNEAVDRADVLAAHVERMRSAIHEAFMLPVSVSPGTAEAEELQDLRDIIGVAAAESPQVSLSRIKAQWQAEALEEAAGGMTFDGRTQWMLRRIGENKRRQVGGGDS